MVKFFPGHDPKFGCNDFLPKPKKWHESVIAQCSQCGRLYVGKRGYSKVYWLATVIEIGKK